MSNLNFMFAGTFRGLSTQSDLWEDIVLQAGSRGKAVLGAVVPGQSGGGDAAPYPTSVPPAEGSPVGSGANQVQDIVMQSLDPSMASDLGTFILVMAGIFAAIGFFRGSKREFNALLGVLLAYLVFSRGWLSVVDIVNKLWRVFYFAVVRRGVLANDPGQAWSSIQVQPLIPIDQPTPLAQISFFGVAVAIIYAFTRDDSDPNYMERIVGAIVASVTGYVVGVFVLARMLPGASISLLEPGRTAIAWITRLGPLAGLLFMAAVILFGFKSLGPKGFARRY